MAALVRLSSPTLRALGGRELLIMAGLLIIGAAIMILGACQAAEYAVLPSVLPPAVTFVGGMLAGIDVFRIVVDSQRWLGDPPGPLAAVPSSSNWMLLFGAVLCGGGGLLLAPGRLGVLPASKQNADLSKTRTGGLPKTYHANRWWMRDGSGSVLIWNDEAQAWSPWVPSRDPSLPPGWSEANSRDTQCG